METSTAQDRICDAFGKRDISQLRKAAKMACKEILQDRSLVYHPLGFLDHVVFETDHWRCKLHIWNSEFGRPEKNPQIAHSHGWEMASAVLVGEITDTLYRLPSEPKGSYQICSVDYSKATKKGGRETSSPIETVLQVNTENRRSLEVLEVRTVQEGTIYSLDSNTFHSSAAMDPTVTLMLANTKNAKAPRVVRYFGEDFSPNYSRVTLDYVQTEKVLSAVYPLL